MSRELKSIQLRMHGQKVIYHSVSRTVTMQSKTGAMIQIDIPKSWNLVETFIFMHELVFSDEVLYVKKKICMSRRLNLKEKFAKAGKNSGWILAKLKRLHRKEVWQKYCDLNASDFDKWLHDEMHKDAKDANKT